MTIITIITRRLHGPAIAEDAQGQQIKSDIGGKAIAIEIESGLKIPGLIDWFWGNNINAGGSNGKFIPVIDREDETEADEHIQ